ncbi:hypothetical protein JTB14_035704 [Gonioctena quinquepunctata]|nr:hypothetical protein JTB14_035704 [Gonioctena quinquepunctata]
MTGNISSRASFTCANHNEKSVEEVERECVEKGEPEKTLERPQWGRSIEFVMSCIAMNVGLGNIWRFPFVAYENGGGAFLIPYLIVLIVFGRPMYYLEMCLGQFSSRGNVKMFEGMAPILKESEREQEYLEMLAQEMYNESDEDVNDQAFDDEDILEVRCENSDTEQDLTDKDDYRTKCCE